jgi:AcrR family transcriptional regulator
MCPRRRSARVHDRILDATALLFERRGILGTSMDAIAAEAGVSKATLYGHWADKDALFLEALGRLFGLDETPPDVDSGDLRTDLAALLRYRGAAARVNQQKRVLPHLMAYASQNRTFGTTWRARVMTPARTRLTKVLTRAIAQGRLPRDLHVEAAVAILVGPIVFREAFAASLPGLPEDLPERVADTFCRAYEISARPMRATVRPHASTRGTATRAAPRPSRA